MLCKLRIIDTIVVILSVIREKNTLMMNDENNTDGRAHKLLRLPFFFCFFHLIQIFLFLFFSTFISYFFLFLSLLLPVVVLYHLHEQEKNRNETNINLLSTNRRKPADVRSKAIG
jgi:membrane protein insertase Oxa1/YidC/SpoIIIJ